MARADLIVDLVDAQRKGDDSRFRVLVEAIIAEERGKQHHLLADRLMQLITSIGSSALLARDDSARPVADLLHEVVPRRRLADLQLDDLTAAAAAEVVEEHHRTDLLRSHGIEPRNRVLLEGPPGNGKTSLAEAFAAETMVPFYVVRYEGVVSSFLGETTGRLDHVFEFARTRRCVLFFDEFDTLAKERADPTRRARSSGSSPPCCCRSTGCPPTCSSSVRPTTLSCSTVQRGGGSRCGSICTRPHGVRQRASSSPSQPDWETSG
jgi:hypothetical protein